MISRILEVLMPTVVTAQKLPTRSSAAFSQLGFLTCALKMHTMPMEANREHPTLQADVSPPPPNQLHIWLSTKLEHCKMLLLCVCVGGGVSQNPKGNRKQETAEALRHLEASCSLLLCSGAWQQGSWASVIKTSGSYCPKHRPLPSSS